MPVTDVVKNPDTLTLTVTAEFAAPLERVWDAYLDARKLERFWGPPTWPSQFTRHDAAPGGLSHYCMTGPDGEKAHGYWEWLALVPHERFEILEGFSHDDGTPDRAMPVIRMVFTFEPTESGSKVTTVTHFDSDADLRKLMDMGLSEGLQQAMEQMDDVIADLRTFAADLPTHTQILSDTQVRISRVIKGSPEQVWRAHHEPALMQRWLLGPDGWTMPVCEIAQHVGETYRYEWEKGSDRFGFSGQLLESTPPVREVTSESPIGLETATTNELTLTPVAGGTLLTLVVTYPSAEVRDIVLATGMTDGMETSYRRLEQQVLAVA